MTLDRFERIVLRLAIQAPVRYWTHWNYPVRDPWLMALKVYRTHGFNPPDDLLTADLMTVGVTSQTAGVYWVERTNDDGTPFTRLDPAKVMGKEPKPKPGCTCSAATLIRGGHSGWETFDHEPTCPMSGPKEPK